MSNNYVTCDKELESCETRFLSNVLWMVTYTKQVTTSLTKGCCKAITNKSEIYSLGNMFLWNDLKMNMNFHPFYHNKQTKSQDW